MDKWHDSTWECCFYTVEEKFFPGREKNTPPYTKIYRHVIYLLCLKKSFISAAASSAITPCSTTVFGCRALGA